MRSMRTTLDIDDDVLDAATELGRARSKSAGEIISELARKSLALGSKPALPDPPLDLQRRNGFPVLPPSDYIVTTEFVQKLIDGIEEGDAGNASASGREFSSGNG